MATSQNGDTTSGIVEVHFSDPDELVVALEGLQQDDNYTLQLQLRVQGSDGTAIPVGKPVHLCKKYILCG